VQCARCRADNREGRRFCGECGLSLATTCPFCGFSNEGNEKFCGGCGRALTAAIDALPPDYRTALVLHDVEGVANSEIAETLGVGLPTVKSRVHRARLFVRQRLSTYLESAS